MKRKNLYVTLVLLILLTFSLSSVCLGATLNTNSLVQVMPNTSLNVLAAPSNLAAAAVSDSEIKLTWKDNNSGTSRFQVERKGARGTFVSIGSTLEGVTEFTDKGLSSATTYYYRVKAYTRTSTSVYSNEASAKTDIKISILDNPGMVIPDVPKPLLPPAAPSGLTATAVSANRIYLAWTDNSDNESRFIVERKVSGGSFDLITEMGPNSTTSVDISVTPGTTYYYRVKASNALSDSQYSNEASATPQLGNEVILEYVVGSTEYKVNGVPKIMDVAPKFVNGRVYLPVRYVVEPLGANMAWDAALQKLTIVLGSKTIELTINSNMATINGVSVMIDPNNPDVTPLMEPPGRIMVPVRFVSTGLGCVVTWDQALQKVTVEYNPQ